MAYNAHGVIAGIKNLNLSLGKYIVVGGASLAVRDIRETRDLDIIVLPSLFNELILQGWELDAEYHQKWNRDRVKRGDVEIYPDLYLEKQNRFLDVRELITNADVVENIPFQPLEHLMMCKLDGGREKDLNDVALIKNYLETKE